MRILVVGAGVIGSVFNRTWSALRLCPAKDDHPPDTSTATRTSSER
jgi:hypothetical protein